ncbi:prepilin [Candidatus Williamhamiltonella defendens]|nr:type 4 pilus major pilin [Candidatus Hamiltonella defensa]AYB48871.1 prepilin [Candidatus Hamiltonella defensa]
MKNHSMAGYRHTQEESMKNRSTLHRGFLSLEMMGVLAIISVAIVLAVGTVSSLFNKSTLNDEIANVQALVTQSRGLLKTQGEYPFSNGAKMTGTLVQFGGVPGNMTINGDKSKGEAKITNGWGGEVMIAPEKVQGSVNNKGFSVTYKNVPQEACSVMTTKLSGSAMIQEISISGSHHIGAVTAEKAGAQCKPDNGSVGVNTLIFKSNH